MENWGQSHIRNNLPKLIAYIDCNVQLLAELQSASYLSPQEVDEVKSKSTPQEKADQLLRYLYTKDGSYAALVEALDKCLQSGALKELIKGIETEGISNVVVSIHGIKFKLGEILSTGSKVSLTELLGEQPNISDYLKYSNSEIEHSLFKEAVPPVKPYYVSRQIHSKRNVRMDIFSKPSKDVFLVKGVQRLELYNLANQNSENEKTETRILYSDEFSQTKRARFVLLQPNYKHDLHNIVSLSQAPVHLIELNSEKNYILSDTWGGIETIQSYLTDEHCVFDEAVLMQPTDIMNNITIICDIPGIGKSQLISKIVETLQQDNRKTVILYLTFPVHLNEFLELVKELQNSSCQVQNILKMLSSNIISYNVLCRLIYKEKWCVCLFLDGYEHVLSASPILALDFLKNIKINKILNRLFVTARPNVKLQLETTLEKISYKLCRLNSAKQTELLSKFPEFNQQHISAEKLAQLCLESVNFGNILETHSITSIPFFCVLLGETYWQIAEQSHLSSHSKRFKSSVPNDEKKQNLFKIFQKVILNSYKDSSGEHHEKVLKFFTWAALKVKFEDIAQMYARIFSVTQSTNVPEHTRLGSIQALSSDISVIKFTHEMFAEYIIAEFVVNALRKNSNFNLAYNKLTTSICNQLFSCQEHSQFENPIRFPVLTNERNITMYEFKHKFICMFFDANLSQTASFELCDDALKLLSNNIFTAGILYNILLCCALDGCSGILSLVKQVIRFIMKRKKSKQRKEILEFLNTNGMKNICENLLLVASSFSNSDIVLSICELFENCFELDLNFLLDNCDKSMLTPLHLGIFRGDIGIVEKLHTVYATDWQGRGFLQTCVFDTHGKQLFHKLDILRLLISAYKGVLNDVCTGVFPIMTRNCDLQLLKIMIEKSTNIVLQTYDGDNIAFSSIHCLSPDEYHDLATFIFKTCCEANTIFSARNNSLGRMPLHEALAFENFQIKPETVRLVLDRICVPTNSCDQNGDTFLSLAISGKKSPEVVKELINQHQDVFFKNYDNLTIVDIVENSENHEILCHLLGLADNIQSFHGNTLLHLSAMWHTPQQFHDCVSSLVGKSLTKSLSTQNFNMLTPLHLAIQKMNVFSETIELYVKADEASRMCKDSQGNNLVLTAVKYKRSIDVIEKLISLGVDYKHSNNYCENALHIAVTEELSKHFEYFVNLGLSKDLPDKVGNTPANLARKRLIRYLAQFKDVDMDRVNSLLSFHSVE